MNQPIFQRARTPEAKAARRAAILAAASAVLAREGLEGTTLNAIATEAGVVKSNLYRYFESREEILMRLLTKDLQEVSGQLSSLLATPHPPVEIAAILASGLSANPRLCLLISITASTLEHNISTQTLREIKRDMVVSLSSTAAALRHGLSGLDQPAAENAVHVLFALTAGLWPLSAPGPALKALYADVEFARFDQDFEQVLAQAFGTMLKGLSPQAPL